VIGVPVRSEVLMGTIVTIQVVRDDTDDAIARAFGWFEEIESRCSRFDEHSELVQLSTQIGVPVPASPILFEAVRFSLVVAAETGGAFDPTVGLLMHAQGFNREYRTGRTVRSTIARDGDVSYRDVEIDAQARTITLHKPLLLDLGSVAKGLAVDAAARELQPLQDFAIDAGGVLYLGGCNPHGVPWTIGIRHPRADGALIDSFRISDKAVCTSGDYERAAPNGTGHILDPRRSAAATDSASVTVVAPTALAADALATAAFVLGPAEGIDLLVRHGAEGLIVSTELERFETPDLPR
jgi:thiamine biosynthesis lipoprotein